MQARAAYLPSRASLQKDGVAVLEGKEAVEVAPDELKHHPVRALVGGAGLALVALDLGVDGAGGDAAVGQPGCKLCGVVAA